MGFGLAPRHHPVCFMSCRSRSGVRDYRWTQSASGYVMQIFIQLLEKLNKQLFNFLRSAINNYYISGMQIIDPPYGGGLRHPGLGWVDVAPTKEAKMKMIEV